MSSQYASSKETAIMRLVIAVIIILLCGAIMTSCQPIYRPHSFAYRASAVLYIAAALVALYIAYLTVQEVKEEFKDECPQCGMGSGQHKMDCSDPGNRRYAAF